MKWLWPGWLLCALTAGLFVYMNAVQGSDFSKLLGGLKTPDAMCLTGYDLSGARGLFDRLVEDLSVAKAESRSSASELYVAIHASSDLLFPPLMALSLAFLGFAALHSRGAHSEMPRLVRIGLGLVWALAFVYLVSDFIENAVADAMFGPDALKAGLNEQLVFVLQVLTASKFLTLFTAFGIIAMLWVWRLKSRVQAASLPTKQ